MGALVSLEEAQARVLETVAPLGIEAVPLRTAAGRVLRETLAAPIDLPRFDNSAMDGYAVRAEDLQAASPERPVVLGLGGTARAGRAPEAAVSRGTCVRVFTGSMLPPGADAVVMQEDVSIPAPGPAEIHFHEPIAPWENVRLRGEDVRSGAVVAEAGRRMRAGLMALLAALGTGVVRVSARPAVAVIATGDELAEAGTALGPASIYESNRAMLVALAASAGAEAGMLPLVPDDRVQTREALQRALRDHHAVISSGGVSVGDFDVVKQAFSDLGGEAGFWRVALKPGKPFMFGRWEGRLFFGLPGNPASALVTFLLLVRPALLKLQAATEVHLPSSPARLLGPAANRGDRRQFLRVEVTPGGEVRVPAVQASHSLSSLAGANGLLDLAPGEQRAAGEIVNVLRWDG